VTPTERRLVFRVHAIRRRQVIRNGWLRGISLKAFKILVGSLAAFWALALLVHLPGSLAEIMNAPWPYALATAVGSIGGMVFMAAVAFWLFRSAFGK